MQPKQVSQNTLIAGIVISMFLWGLSWPSGKVLTQYCTAINFSVYRYLLVVLGMWAMLWIMKTPLTISKAGIPTVIASGICLAVYSYFFFLGLKRGNAGAGGVLVTILNPIMAYSIGMLLNRKAPTRNEAIGLGIGLLAGGILLKVWDTSTSLLASGNLFFLLASLMWAVLSKFASKGGQYGSSLSFSLWQYLITLLCLLPLANFTEMAIVIRITSLQFWGNLFFSAIVVTTIATTIYFYSTTRLGAEKASSFIFLVPLAAAASSWLLLGERIQPHTAIGGTLGIAAVYLINRKVA